MNTTIVAEVDISIMTMLHAQHEVHTNGHHMLFTKG